tara:strand:+ start:272 stop:475 length:204 start_codon:yes stop_codon:yes gene_type:complete
MKMKKISKSRWAMLAFVVACLIVLFNVAGCAMLENQMNTMKGLVGMDDTIVVETPVCEGETCEDIRG